MTLNCGAQRAILAIYFALLAVVYAAAWFSPAIGLDHDDAALLVTAKAIAGGHGYTIESLPQPVSQTHYPPLFPAVLALFTLVSQQAWWLKLLPLACAVAWLALTRKLLLKMGASGVGAMLLVALTAASPTVIFLSTSLLPETLFALLATAALLELLEERALLAGIFAGLATLTRTGGVALIVACILTLAARRRFRAAAVFAAVAMALSAPWFGWSLAEVTHAAYSPGSTHVASDIFTGLAANEKLVVLAHNFVSLFASPVLLLTGLSTVFFVVSTVAILAWCLFVRRQLVPDLFVALYCLSLLFWISPPERYIVPMLPLVFWIVWRVARLMPSREALAALVLIVAAIPFWADGTRLFQTRADGDFPLQARAADNWKEMQQLFTFIRGNTPQDSILLANLDSTFYLETGRKAVRGFTPNNFDLLYSVRQSGVTPDELSNAIVRDRVDYVVLTPDRDLPESVSFHKSVAALERGGVITPVSVPGLSGDYRLFQINAR